MGLSDAELVVRAQQGERSAFAEIVTRYQDRVFNVIFRMCRNRSDAADLTQATFLRAYQALPRFEARAGVYTWLFRIATNQAISEIRRRKRRKPTLDLHGADGRNFDVADDAIGSLERLMDDRDLVDRVAAALPKLDEDFRAAVVLRDIEGLDYATIGEILDLPVGTVKSRIHRGRAVLRELVLQEFKKRDSTESPIL